MNSTNSRWLDLMLVGSTVGELFAEHVILDSAKVFWSHGILLQPAIAAMKQSSVFVNCNEFCVQFF